jgi:PAS domain S-box-containing protein
LIPDIEERQIAQLMPAEPKRAEMRSAAFSTLARKLSGVGIRRDAAQIIVDIADDLLGWDSCVLTMYCVAQDLDTPLISIDTIDGRRVDVTALTPAGPPTVRGRRLIEQAAELVLRAEPHTFDEDMIPFGDEQRPSASIIGVPIRHAAEVIGTLSIYSYRTEAYDRRALLDLQALADHCGAALNRIQGKEALALSESLFRGAFDHAPIGMLVNSPEGRRLKVNRAFCEMLGYSEEELLQSDFWSVLHPDHQRQAQDSLLKVLTERTGIDRLKTRYLHKDGHVVWAKFSETVVRDAKGSPSFLVAQVEDITEQKQAEESLALSEDLFRGAFDQAPIGMALNSIDGRRLKVNAAFCEMVGYTPEELLATDFQDIMHPDDRAEIITGRLELPTKEVADHKEWRYIHKDGHVVWAAVTATVVRSPEGRPLYVVGQMEDVTKRRAAAESLKLFRTLIDRCSDAIEVIDPDTLRFLDCNESAHQCLGYSREEFLSLTVFDIDPVVDQAEVARIHEQAEGPDYTSFESVHRRKDGSTFPVEVNVKMVRLDRDYRLAVVRDITDRKRSEERLKQTKSQLAEAQHVARVGSWNWDVKRDVLTWSDELYCLFGLAPQEVEPTVESYLELIHPEDREFVSRVIEESLESLKPFSHSPRIMRADGEVRVFQTQANVLSDENGNATRMFGICQDVTERKLAEEQLKATSEQLRALSASLRSAREAEGGRIAREIHDELGAALTSLKWDLEGIGNALAGYSQPPPGRLREKIESMMRLADTTINTVRRIASELRPSILDDLGLVSAIQWQTKQFEARTGITSYCHCAFEDLDFDHEQSTAIFRIFQEALTNVLRHAQATRVDIAIAADAGQFVLTISDNGRGITTEEKSRSKSLGLVGMYERAYLIGGRIDIAGVNGEGTLVTVRVPISTQTELA